MLRPQCHHCSSGLDLINCHAFSNRLCFDHHSFQVMGSLFPSMNTRNPFSIVLGLWESDYAWYDGNRHILSFSGTPILLSIGIIYCDDDDDDFSSVTCSRMRCE